MTTIPNLDNLNLDCESSDTLDAIADGLEWLAKYAIIKAEAMHFRLIGEIEEAREEESKLESIYHNVPVNWRW